MDNAERKKILNLINTSVTPTTELSMEADEKAENAQENALEAITLAEGVNEHFWYDSTGAHITEDTQEDYQQDPSSAGGNTLITSQGMAIRQGTTQLAAFTGVGAQIGLTGETHAKIDYHSLQLYDKEGYVYFDVADLRTHHTSEDEWGEGFYYDAVDTFEATGDEAYFNLNYPVLQSRYKVSINGVEVTTGITIVSRRMEITPAPVEGDIIVVEYATQAATLKAYTLGLRDTNYSQGAYSISEGRNNVASGYCSHAEGQDTTARAYCAHAEGVGTTASQDESHAEGSGTTASGAFSHSEGGGTVASEWASHAEGYKTEASGSSAHAEGWETIASGDYSHAEGRETTASGMYSHAEGNKTSANTTYAHAQNQNTIASKLAQTAIGTYNVEDTSTAITHPSNLSSYGKYAFIIGNGTWQTRSNALTVDWQGNVETAGNVTDGNGNVLSNKIEASSLPTVETWTPNITAATGTLVSKYGLKFGNVYFLSVGIRKTSSTSSGANFFSGTLSNNLPTYPVSSAGYENAVPMPANLNTNGVLNVRNASPSAYSMGSSSHVRISFTYIINS